jgi:hypothetical protein
MFSGEKTLLGCRHNVVLTKGSRQKAYRLAEAAGEVTVGEAAGEGVAAAVDGGHHRQVARGVVPGLPSAAASPILQPRRRRLLFLLLVARQVEEVVHKKHVPGAGLLLNLAQAAARTVGRRHLHPPPRTYTKPIKNPSPANFSQPLISLVRFFFTRRRGERERVGFNREALGSGVEEREEGQLG